MHGCADTGCSVTSVLHADLSNAARDAHLVLTDEEAGTVQQSRLC